MAALIVFHPLLRGKLLGRHCSRQAPFREIGGAGVDPRFTDLEVALLPWLRETSRQLAAGRIPLWNPFAGTGAPLLANEQSAVFHPFTIAGLLFGWRAALTLGALLRFGLAFAGTAALARNLGAGGAGAFLSAASYALSGSLLEWVAYPLGGAFAHVPAILWAARWRSRAAPALLAALLASSVLNGHFEYLPLIWIAALALLVVSRPRPGVFRALGPFSAAAALSALFLLPCVEYLAQKRTIAEHPRRLSIAPKDDEGAQEGLLRVPTSPLHRHGPNQLVIARTSFGFLVLVLAFAGLGAPRAAAIGGPTLLALVLVYDNPLTRALTAFPPLSLVARDRLLIAVALGLSLLAGLGLSELAAGRGRTGLAILGLLVGASIAATAPAYHNPFVVPPPHAAAVSLAAGALGVLAVAAGRQGPAHRAVPLAAIAVLLGDRAWQIGGLNQWAPRTSIYPDLPVLARARDLAGTDRVIAPGRTLHPNAATVYGMRDVRGYDAIGVSAFASAFASEGAGLLPNAFSRRAAARVLLLPPDRPEIAITDEEGETFPAEPGFVKGLAVRTGAPPGTAVTIHGPSADVATGVLGVDRDAGGWIAVRLDGPISTPERAIYRVAIEGADVTAVRASYGRVPAADREECSPELCLAVDPAAAQRVQPSRPGPGAAAAIEVDAPDLLAFAIDLPAADRVTVADARYPGWGARIDGEPARLEDAGPFRAIDVPAGRHRVVMTYEPASFKLGLFVTLAAALWLSMTMVLPRRRIERVG